MMYLMTAMAAYLVGLSIGICGVAGFLLPIFFVGYCGFPSSASLFLSFGCFLISGAIGAWNYQKRGEMPLKPALTLGLSSLVGGALGAVIGRVYVSDHIKTVLYVVVLISGIMIFVQELITRDKKADVNAGGCEKADASGSSTAGSGKKAAAPELAPSLLVPLGFVTALICALSGAGGPVMVMPLLVLLGMPVRTAVGVALFDSVFIAIPAIIVYGSQTDIPAYISVMLIAFAAHAAGILTGSRLAAYIPPKPLKRGVAVFSIVFAIWRLFG
ncbi:MAG: sulfite exporter TauE/SafE family protein [Lachnospiraceae bacterium]|nr:sulfite exporter TauE/SafE family protein [Lachnospiraceae bacterium]